jgi:hypothetical protein
LALVCVLLADVAALVTFIVGCAVLVDTGATVLLEDAFIVVDAIVVVFDAF